ncbi:MAG: SRPBCC domain-containing protein, partial [Sphingomonas bacterium]
PDTMAFYGKYLEVVPNERIVWTNDEGEEGAITTVTFEDLGGKIPSGGIVSMTRTTPHLQRVTGNQ